MKNFLQNALVPIFILIFSYQVNAQNAIIGTGFTNGWSVPGDLVYFTAGAGSSRVATLNPRAAGNQYFRLVRGWSGDNTQFAPAGCVDTDWTNPGVIYGMSACGSGAFFINCPNTTDNYVFKTPNGPTSVDLLYFRVQGAVRSVTSTTRTANIANQAVTVTANLDGALSTGQQVYLRYSTNNFSTSTVVTMTGSGSTYSGIIPAAVNTAGANVSYYLFTSGTGVATDGSNADTWTINLNNNAGSNYTYSISSNPITVTSTGGTGLPFATYANMTTALAAINGGTVHNGTVTCFVNTGYTEIVPAGGHSITATYGTSGTPITFVKNGTGANPTFTAPAQTGFLLTDAIFKIIGGDFITIDGFTMLERNFTPVAADTTAGTNTMTEFGVALFYATTTNGCQNITIRNCTIDLNRTYQNTFGIYANSTHTATAPTIGATATGATGGNHNLTITGNTITDVNQGISITGPTAAADNNDNVVIGGSALNANTITNYGTTGTFSGYINISGTVNGILVRNTLNTTISNNTITSSVGGVTAGTLNGIQIPASTVAPTGTFTVNINNNNISLRSGLIGGAMNGINLPSGSASTTSILNINANDFNTFGHTVAGTGAITFITNAGAHLTQSISNNTFTNMSVNTTGSVTFISNSVTLPATGTKNVNSNSIVTAFNKTGAGGTVTLYTDSGSSTTGSSVQNNNNNFSNITVTGATTIAGWLNTDGTGATPTKQINNNTFSNWTGGSSSITVINNSFGGNTTLNNNTISTITGTGSITGLTQGNSGTITTLTINANTITGLSSTGTAGSVTALSNASPATTTNINGNTINTLSSNSTTATVVGITSSASANLFDNVIHTLSCLGSTSGVSNGIMITGGATNSVYRNKIYNLQTTGAFTTTPGVNGILITGGTTNTVYNNTIGGLTATAANSTDAIRGISITSTTTFTTQNIFHNSILLNASSSGTNFGTSGIFHTFSTTATTSSLNLRNNIIVNNSTPAGTGRTVAFRRSAATNLNNYATTSNNNLFFAGTPGANNVIFSDGTNNDQTLADFKTRMSTRDQASQTENTTFQSTTGSDTNFLRIAAGTTSYAESGAVLISTPNINTDYWGVTRPFPSPTNGGSTPDMGASEFDGIPALANCIAPIDQASAFVAGAVTSTTVAATFTAASSLPSGYLVIATDGVAFSGTVTDGTVYTAGATLGNGRVIQSNSSLSIAATALTSNSNVNFTILSYNSGSCAGGPKYNLTTPLLATMTTCAGPVTLPVTNTITTSGFTANWTQPATGSAFTLTYSVEVTTDAAYGSQITGSPFTTTSLSRAISGLSPQTNYYWRVRANNTICDGAYLNAGLVTTECAAITTFPSVEPFTTYLPTTCWKEGDLGDLTAGPAIIGDAVSDWIADGFLNSGATGAAKMNIDTATGSEWIISPYYTIPATGYRVKYNVGATNFGLTTAVTNWEVDDFVELLVSTSNTNWTVLRTYNSSNVPSNLGQVDQSDLSAYNGQTVRFAFRAVEGATNGDADLDFFIDNFTVELAPTPITVSSNVAICNGTSTTLSVSSANTNYAYTWSPATGLSATTGASVTANPTTTTVYTVTAVDGTMTTSGTVTVTVNASPSNITVTPAATTVCAGGITTLVASGGVIVGTSKVGSGTSSNTTSTPFKGFWGGSKSQALYTAAELTSLGLTNGSAISSIGYVVTAGTPLQLNNFTVNAGLVSASTIGTSFISGATTTVFTGATYTPPTGSGNIDYTLSAPIVWDGTSSLLVETCFNNNNAGGGSNNSLDVQSSTVASGLNIFLSQDSNATVCTNTTAPTSQTSRPNLRISYSTSYVTWSPTTDLYTNAAASTAYTGQVLSTVYHRGATNTYTASATVGTCSKTASTTITVNPNVTPTFTAVDPICAGATLSALPTTSTNGITGTWAPALDNTATTTYTFTPTAGQCATTTTLAITVNPNVAPTFTAVDPICTGATLSALPTTSTNGITGTWAPALDNTATTTYTFTPTAGQCATTTTLAITVNPIVNPTFTAVDPICAGATLSALPTTSTNGITGTWTPALDNTATTTYTFTPTAGQCATTTTLEITVNPIVTSTFNQVAAICAGDTFTLPTTSLQGVTGTWSPAISNTSTTAYTFTPTSGQCATTATMTVTVGGTSTWSGSPAVWSPAAPTSIDAAVIAANYSESASLTACTLTVNNNAVVTIPAGTNLNVQGVVNVVSGSMALANTANLNQVHDVTNTGNISVTCTTTSLKRLDYVLWSAPVTGQQLQSFSPGTLADRFYTYNSSSNLYESIASPSTTNFIEGNGYLIRVPNTHSTSATALSRTFTGVPNNGNVNLSVTNGTWNAIGNPYPSTIDADEFITANGLTDALYFWRKTNNATTTSYATYTLAGGAGTASNTGGNSSLVPDETISIGQGFLAKATSSTLSFTNAMRNGDVSTQFFRPNSIERSRVWLNLFDTDGFKNQMLIAYLPSATNGIDEAIDGRFYENDIPTQLSSLINGEEFAVQGRAPFTVSDIVPLGFRVETTGNYSVAIDHVDGLFADGQEVFLKDNFTNTVHNLTNAPYNFVASTGTTNARFEIVFESNLATENPVLNENTVIIYKQNQDIVVNTGKIEMKNVQVYDIQGRLLVQQKDVNASTSKLSVGTTNQVLIVKVTSKDNSVVTKKVIN
jgi:hypothetical protein